MLLQVKQNVKGSLAPHNLKNQRFPRKKKKTFYKDWASLTKHAQTCVGTQSALEIELHLIYCAL